MNKSEKTTKSKAKAEQAEEKPSEPKRKWKSAEDDTHGNGEYDLFGIKGLIREKGCRQIGGMQVRGYLTTRADAPIGNRSEKYTIVLTGTHEKGVTDLNMDRLQKTGAPNRKEMLILCRDPAKWSSKARTIVQKLADEAAKKEKEAEKAKEEKSTEAEPTTTS